MQGLRESGSVAAPGFMKPEGVVCFHIAGGFGFKARAQGLFGGYNEAAHSHAEFFAGLEVVAFEIKLFDLIGRALGQIAESDVRID